MKQVKAFGPKDLRVVESASPEVGEGEVLVDVHACGICGSDKWFWHVDSPNDYVAGHEVAGEVIGVGPGIKHLSVGDRVAINNVKGCGECEACRKGEFVRCVEPLIHMGFGFSEKVAVPERNCLKLKPEISYMEGSLIFDNWGTPYSAIKRTSMKQDDLVLVTGCGPIGLAAVALSNLRGAKVIAVDPIQERREAAQKQGAVFVLEPGPNAADRITEYAGGASIDIALECSGKPDSYEVALRVVRVAGTIVSIGEGAQYPFKSSDIIHKHVTIIGSLYSTMEDGAELQEMMINGDIDPAAFVTHTMQLENLSSTFGDVIEFREGLLKAIMVRE